MRIPFISMFTTSPFDGLQEHAEKVKECAWVFQRAIECIIEDRCEDFEHFRKDIDKLESEADAVKRRVRGHLPKGTLLAVDKFELFRYLREQDKVIDAVEEGLDWLSFRAHAGIPQALEKDFMLLVAAVMDPIEELSKMVTEARKYFSNFSNSQRVVVKDMIRTLRHYEHEADKLEDTIKEKIFNTIDDGVVVFHLIRLTEIIGSIADHAENAGDMMRAMVAK
ncbi:MAG: TIGR00153 family protein [Desulfobacteraceae bacterium]|jgi:predicted phosphate transport protein (TIGR00153 family)|nr:TIGR00153 family protein [Desulfobacteraceae bacterium]